MFESNLSNAEKCTPNHQKMRDSIYRRLLQGKKPS